MMQSYRASYQMTRQQLEKSIKLHYQIRYFWELRIVVIGAMFLLIALFNTLSQGYEKSIFYYIVFGLYPLMWSLWKSVSFRYASRRGFEKSPVFNAFIVWEFNSEGFSRRVERMASGSSDLKTFVESSWKALVEVFETEDGFLFYLYNKAVYTWVPYDAFEDAEGIKQVKEFLRLNHVKVIQRG